MAENLFTDFPERAQQLAKYSDLEKIALPLEEAFGEKGFYKSSQEAMEFYLGVLEELGKVCAKEVKPTAAEIDAEGTKFENGKVTLNAKLVDHLKKFSEMGLFSGQVGRKYGGLNLPYAVQIAALEVLGHACVNTGLTVAAFSMGGWIEKWGTEEQKQRVLPKLLYNEWQTSMALTEPNAGSDLGKLRTSAKRDGDRFIVNGTKQFITNGNSDLVFVLARTDPASQGLNGLSVILCPKDLVKVAKIEEKICLHSSPTCELVFENVAGQLFGPEGSGFKVMADLMNSARLAMSALGLGIAVNALEEAKTYAQERVTMGKPIIQHPMVADLLFEMEMEIRGMRALVIEAACAYDWMNLAAHNNDEKNFKRWRKRYRRLTPLCKYHVAERTVVICRNALQIFGGYGVCRDYPAERLLRESLIFPIYEGTSQIQSLMVLKDTLKDVATQATGFLGSLAGSWAEAKVTRDPVKSNLLQARNELNQGIRTILLSIIKEKFKSDIEALKQSKIQEFIREFSLQLLTSKTDLTYPFLCAERFTRITCDYYALKCMADHLPSGDKERAKWITDYAELCLARMQMENRNMVSRLPATLDYLKTFERA